MKRIWLTFISRFKTADDVADLAIQRLLEAAERAERTFEKHRPLTSPGD